MSSTYDKLAHDVDRALLAAASEAAVVASGWAKDAARTTVDSAGHVGRVDKGGYVKSISASPAVDRGSYVEATVYVRPPAAEIAAVLEEGRTPGKPISLAGRFNIRSWVERNLLASALTKAHPDATVTTRTRKDGSTVITKVKGVKKADREALLDSLTFLVVRKIRRSGSPGIHAMGQARTRLKSPEGAAIVSEVLARFLLPDAVA